MTHLDTWRAIRIEVNSEYLWKRNEENCAIQLPLYEPVDLLTLRLTSILVVACIYLPTARGLTLSVFSETKFRLKNKLAYCLLLPHDVHRHTQKPGFA